MSNAKIAEVHKWQEQTHAFILKCYCFSIFKAMILLDMCKLRVMHCTAETKQTVQKGTSNWNWIDQYIFCSYIVENLDTSILHSFLQEYIFWGRGWFTYKVYSYKNSVAFHQSTCYNLAAKKRKKKGKKNQFWSVCFKILSIYYFKIIPILSSLLFHSTLY